MPTHEWVINAFDLAFIRYIDLTIQFSIWACLSPSIFICRIFVWHVHVEVVRLRMDVWLESLGVCLLMKRENDWMKWWFDWPRAIFSSKMNLTFSNVAMVLEMATVHLSNHTVNTSFLINTSIFRHRRNELQFTACSRSHCQFFEEVSLRLEENALKTLQFPPQSL